MDITLSKPESILIDESIVKTHPYFSVCAHSF